jgi:hypothetical protein
MTHTVTLDIPEQGQLVEVRQRRCVVTDIAGSMLPSSPLDAGNGKPQHLVTLTSIEDDVLVEAGVEFHLHLRLEASGEVDANLVNRSVNESLLQFNPWGKLDVEEQGIG